MAKKPAKTIARSGRNVKKKVSKRVTSHTLKKRVKKKTGKRKIAKTAAKRRKIAKTAAKKRKVTKKVAKRVAKKRKVSKKASKKRAVKKRVHTHRVRPGKKKRPEKKKRPPRRPIILPISTDVIIQDLDLERMAAQIAQRISDKVIRAGHLIPDPIIPGHWKQTAESRILIHLIEAEQTGTFNDALYDLAGEYEGYESPSDIYSLWIYSGE